MSEDAVYHQRLDPMLVQRTPPVPLTDGVLYTPRSGGALAWSGSVYGVVWTVTISDYNIGFMPLSGSGASLASERTVFAAPTNQYCTDMVWKGSEWALLWTQDNNIWGGRLGLLGTETTSNQIVGPNAMYPDMVWNGSQLGFIYSSYNGTQYDLRFNFLDMCD